MQWGGMVQFVPPLLKLLPMHVARRSPTQRRSVERHSKQSSAMTVVSHNRPSSAQSLTGVNSVPSSLHSSNTLPLQ